MNNVIVFIAPTIDTAMRQKLAESLRIRGIATTDKKQNATLIIADVERPVKRMGIADVAEKLIDEYAQKFVILKHEFLLLNQKPKKTKSELNLRHPLKQFNQTKKICRQRFFNRTNCK